MEKYRPWLYAFALFLLLPALLIHLGLLAFIDDEAIRSLVAMEMKLTGNLITPKMHGDYYYNKPPLYNWIILVFFQLTGTINEYTARLPTIFALTGYGLTIFFIFRKFYGIKIAFLNALFFITCGRVLFWDSMLALIDICFSWVTFSSFMVVFHFFQKERYYPLFLISYLLTAIGFLMKGLPSVVFQGTTLLVYFIYRKRFRKLFSLAHVTGGLVFLLIVGSYYLAYSQINSLENVLPTLFSESSKRTVVQYGILNTIIHLFTFPFEMIYHFLPWSLMILYFIRKDIIPLIRKDAFITFNLITFTANILIYWSSPEVYPRYLLMLAPLIFSAFLYLHGVHQKENTWQFKIWDRTMFVACMVIATACFSPLFIGRTQGTPYLYLKTLSVGAGLVALTVAYYKFKTERLLVLVLFLLVFRIGFNWFVLPDRNSEDFGNLCRMSSLEMGRQFADRDMYIYKGTTMQPTNSFYLTLGRGRIIRRHIDQFVEGAVYIIDPKRYPDVAYEKVGEIYVRHGKLVYHVGILK